MVPTYYVPLEKFIYTPNGKIDRKKLPLPKNLSKMSNEEYIAPKNEMQKKLVKIFEKVLNVKPIGINDNFFELGGDSLLAMKLSVELLKITNRISYSDIFKYSTVDEMEEKINSDNGQVIHNKIEEIQDLLRKIFGKKYSVVAVNNEEYSNILKEYKKNIDSGKIYKYIEEPHIETKDNKNTKIENTAETLFGKDCIIVE